MSGLTEKGESSSDNDEFYDADDSSPQEQDTPSTVESIHSEKLAYGRESCADLEKPLSETDTVHLEGFPGNLKSSDDNQVEIYSGRFHEEEKSSENNQEKMSDTATDYSGQLPDGEKSIINNKEKLLDENATGSQVRFYEDKSRVDNKEKFHGVTDTYHSIQPSDVGELTHIESHTQHGTNTRMCDETTEHDSEIRSHSQRTAKRGNINHHHSEQLQEKPKFDICNEIDPGETDYITIQFNTLILKEYWKKVDAICLRIGHEYFNNFQKSVVQFSEVSSIKIKSGKFVIIKGRLKFPTRYTDKKHICFPYKYFLYTKDGNASFEHLHHSFHINFDRYFYWKVQEKPDGTLVDDAYQHYDMMILPDIPRKESSSFWGVWEVAVNLVTPSAWNKKLPFSSIIDRILVSLQVLLPNYLGCGESQPCNCLEEFLKQFDILVNSLLFSYFRNPDSSTYRYWEPSYCLVQSSLTKVIEAWITTNYCVEKISLFDPRLIVCKFYLACYLIWRYKINNKVITLRLVNFIEESIVSILQKKSYTFDKTICTNVAFGNVIQSSIQEFIFNRIPENTNPVSFLLLVPLYHRINNLQDYCIQLHEEFKIEQNEYWGFPDTNTLYWLDNIPSDSKELQKSLTLVKYDYILPYTIAIYTLNETNARSLCGIFIKNSQYCPLSALMGVVLHRLKRTPNNNSHRYTHKCSTLITEVLQCLNAALKENTSHLFPKDMHHLSVLTQRLALGKFMFDVDQFTLCLQLLSQTLRFCDTNTNINPVISYENLKGFFEGFVVEWCTSNIWREKMYYYNYKTEIRFWEDLLIKYYFPKSTKWVEIVENYLTIRFKDHKITQQFIVDLFLYLHDRDDHPPLLQEIFLKELTSRMLSLKLGENNEFVKQLFRQLSDTEQLCKVNKIFSDVLLNERNNFDVNPINHFVTWTSWDTYFRLLYFDNVNQIISWHAKDMLVTAKIQFLSLFQLIQELSITRIDIQLISKNEDYFINLANILMLSEPESHKYSIQNLRKGMNDCLRIHNWINEQRTLIASLNGFLDSLYILNHEMISDFLGHDLEHEYIRDICLPGDTSYRFNNYEGINETIHYLHFRTICHTCVVLNKSNIIVMIFKSIATMCATSETVFNIETFYESIWTPTIELSGTLLEELSNESIPISKMSEYFDSSNSIESITNDLEQLRIGFMQTQGDPNSEDKPIPKSCARKIHLYSRLKKCSEAARLIIELREVIGIASDFGIIKDLINIKQSYQHKQLKDVNDNVSTVAINLGQLSESNLEVIRTIIDRIYFIKWVKNNMKNLNEVKTFIDISLTTCGGNPVDVDRITCLSSVCTNFAPLIFQIDENTGYETLIARCKQVIESVERNKELTKLLREVGENVKFWEEMKQSHGSVQDSTLMQLDNIINSGVFCLNVVESLNLSDIVSLSVDRDNGEKRIYSLDQLREFRSKVMLVVSKSEQPGVNAQTNSYENSQLFTHKLDTITEIATIVIKLTESGNQDYLKYHLSSNAWESDNCLLNIKVKLKTTLDDWNNKVNEARNTYYFLNFFTISQIVSLQKGLKSFPEGTDVKTSEQLFHLLRLLNREIRNIDIQQALGLERSEIHPKEDIQNPSINTTQDFSTQSLHTAMSTHYSHIGPTKSKKTTSNSFVNLAANETDDFPENFTEDDKKQVTSVCEDCSLSLQLTIKVLVKMKKEQSVISPQSFLKRCMELDNDNDADSVSNEDEIDSETEPADSQISTSCSEDTLENTFIDFHQLGRCLEEIFHSCGNKMRAERQLLYGMKSGSPNLVIIPPHEILEFVISLYMSDNDKLPLPYYHEVLICTAQTKLEEIDIFWRRALLIPKKLNFNVFCAVGIEHLSYEVAVSAVSRLRFYQQKQRTEEARNESIGYKLVLVCSEEKEEFSYMAAAFEEYKIPILTRSKSGDVKRYINQKISPLLRRANDQNRESAWEVDKERSRVRLIVSDSVGAGKSLYIRNLKSDMLTQGIVNTDEIEQAAVTVAIHGKQASEEHLTEQLLSRNISGVEHGIMFHVDIASTVQFGIESILFKLLILGGICKSNGEIWHCRQRDYYVIEMTLTSVQSTSSQFSRLFPNVQCVQPFDALGTSANTHTQTIDLVELRSEQYQRVTAYLKRLENRNALDDFVFNLSGVVERSSHLDCLNQSLKYCGIIRPSWAEVRNFTNFLDKQLSDCDKSDYCQSDVIRQEWIGFKSFVVKFMLIMSRDFATPSLKSNYDLDPNKLDKFEILSERRWENNSHPYIFFNPDGHTMTFLGFHISNRGHLLDSDNPSVVIESNIMHPQLLQMLATNGVLLQENYHQLGKMEKILKISGVMGMEWLADPDPGYVLTLDNMRKILAILMRFRCNIPVVIMGETGCGKTRLIQFMCSLQALQTGANNMLILKVHGGTTERDVMCKVEEAEKLATHNYHNHNIDTVLFFDEANTSPAIGLLKEIMCDRRMYGRHISSNIRLQFIAACNPYRRHTKEMLHKLSTAGLGFFTKSTDTTDRLGDIPLRELVYRVMELPASMRPLVWDFGQLSNDVEKSYTREIVAKHLRDHNSGIEARDDVVDAISEVLAGAQNYMRERNDECSFVSLRDVERAMRVMVWFYLNLKYFNTETQEVLSDESDSVHSLDDEHLMSPTEQNLDTINYSQDSSPTLSQPLYIEDEFQVSSFGEDTCHFSGTLLERNVASSGSESHSVGSEQLDLHEIEDNSGTYYDETLLMYNGVENEQDLLPALKRNSINGIDCITYSLILSLAVCYRAKLQERDEFDRVIIGTLRYPLTQISNYRTIQEEIDKFQQQIIDEMTVETNIAKNNALKENVFMMFVCIELKIPLFVIGKPGSSKSLAKSIISNSMQGNRCPDGSILQNFKQIQIMSYQCSQLSTADGIIGVFKSCRTLQRKTGSNKFTACVVLDEVGLAEDSPLLPLKVLHPLLEDNDYGSDEIEKVVEQDEVVSKHIPVPTTEEERSKIESDDMMDRVAFIGISNWSLDPAKMNRGIMVARGDPDVDELVASARGICVSKDMQGPIQRSIEKKIKHLSRAYYALTSCIIDETDSKMRQDYYGLRDFYSLIKMLVFLCNEYATVLNRPILHHAVKRNFGGLSDVNPVRVFEEHVLLSKECKQGPDSSPLGLIRANLTNLTRSFHGETRYLLLLTENYAALDILTNSQHVWPRQHDVQDIRVIFGSSFPSDQEYSAVCRNINRIKVCMESGKTIILLNLENLYESLYDALNQYYMEMNNQRYVDLGLGTHRMKCRVHNNFKLIVVADTETVRERFPTPLINRLEKHFLTMSTVLSDVGVHISEQLTEWANKFSSLDGNQMFGSQTRGKFTVGDCFIGFHDDTPPSIVFHVMKEMYPDHSTLDIVDETAVLERCQTLLLRMATTDAVLRVKNSLLSIQSDNIIAEYFKLHLGSLEEYLRHVLSSTCNEKTGSHLTLATTHSRLLTDRDVDQLRQRLSSDTDTDRIEIIILSLQQFQTELQYTREIQRFLREESGIEGREGSYKKILLIQCDRGADNAKLIACARHKTVDELKDWQEEKKEFNFEVCLVFLIQLSREVHGSKFVSFCGGEWNAVHIDDIRSLDYTEMPPISELIGKKVHELLDHNEMERIFSTGTVSSKSRLKHCIQPAVSKLEDQYGSGVRIFDRIRDFNLLLTEQNYNSNFFSTLCTRLTNLLKEQYESSNDLNTDWLLQTANCGEDIQSSGTFRKAINLRINDTITPLLAELVACLDRNGNLELALYSEEVPECLFNLWQDIFRDERLLVLQYKDIISPNTLLPRRRVPVLSDGAGGQYFKAHFPFSSMIYQFTSQILSESKNFPGEFPVCFWKRFEPFFDQTMLGEILLRHLKNEDVQFIVLYLRDFIYIKFFPHDNDRNQYMVYESVLMRCFENYSVGDEEFEEPNEVNYTSKLTIPRIHCAYEDSKQLLCLLQQAFVFEKHLGGKLKKVISEMKENGDHKLNHLELVLLEEIISLCSHKKERTAKELLARKYVSEVKQWQPIVEKVLSFKQQNQFGEDLQMNLRHKWNRIVAVQLFISHCTLGVGYSVTESSINKLYMLLGECPDFTSVDVINNILFILSSCLQKINKTMRTLAVTRQKFKDQATRFFISILTNLTFKYLRIRDRNEDLILLLMGFVTLDEKNISGLIKDTEKNINIFKKDGFDPSPGFRAFLLQLFIRHRYDVFKDKISQYLKDTIFHYTDQSMKKELYLLIVQSIEDSHHQRFVQKTSQLQVESLNTLMNNITNQYLADLVLSYEMLEKIATLRFICMHISNWIIECFDLLKTGSDTKIPDHIKKERQRLIISFQDICLMDGYEYLHVLLLKNIYHQLGSDTLHLITESRDCSWIIPEHVMREMAELPVVMPDYFIIYGEDYLRITSAVEQVNLLQKKDALLQFSTTNTKLEIILLECILYSIFQEISRYFYIEQEKRTQSLDEKFLTMKDFINFDLKDINTEVNNLAIQIAANNLGDGHLQNLKLSDTSSNNEIFLIRLIYHVAVMLSCKKYHKLFSPIAMIYENPQVLLGKLFPTMMDDQFLFTKTSMTDVGQWYQCPKGHPYFIGECGRPWVRYNCSECGSLIGGDMHRLATKNTLLDLTRDETKCGYLLGRANNVNSALAGERSLSPAAVKIIRVLLDISFIWSSCSKHPITRSQVLPSLVNGGLDDPRDLPNFFYQHLERDVKDLTQLTGKNFEEVIFFLHLIVKSLMDTAGEQSGIPTELTQRVLREQWEKEFDKRFIQPILSSLHTDVERQMEQVLSEKRIANNPILRIVYEREEPEPNNPLPHLWRYRTIVSVEHFSQSFSTADVNSKDKCPLVDKFLREENKLFVTRYLPDIVQLQIRMRDKFLHRLDRRDAANTTIRVFLHRTRNENKQEWEELSNLVNNFATAWSMIGEDVRKNGRLKMEEALEQQEITPATCLAYLLPSSTGEGVLITSLTDYLVLIHNSFVHAYRDRVKESRSDRIPLHELNTSHVIEYEEHLQPLLLSHAHYSLALGQGSHVTYDFEEVEQQFMEQFIQSKPLILAEHLRFEYTREAYNLDVFEQVRHKVQQIELKEMVWKAIQEDLNSLEAVSDVLLVLDVVIGFLSSVGGLPDQKICSYLYDVLRYAHVTHGAGPLQSRKAEAVLCLKHTLSFWTYLSIEKARKLSIVGQIPFSSLRDEFQHMLSQEEKEKIQKSCNYFQVESVLRYLHDFILFFVRDRSAEEKNFGLRVCMEIYAEEKDCKLPKGFELFPEEITLSQCASTWAELALNIK